jgi:hypothetical protein
MANPAREIEGLLPGGERVTLTAQSAQSMPLPGGGIGRFAECVLRTVSSGATPAGSASIAVSGECPSMSPNDIALRVAVAMWAVVATNRDFHPLGSTDSEVVEVEPAQTAPQTSSDGVIDYGFTELPIDVGAERRVLARALDLTHRANGPGGIVVQLSLRESDRETCLVQLHVLGNEDLRRLLSVSVSVGQDLWSSTEAA